MVGHFTDSDAVLDFLAATEAPAALCRTGHVLPRPLPAPRRSSRWCSTCRPGASVEESIDRLNELAVGYREDYQAYYDRWSRPESPERSVARTPLIVLVPGVGMFSFGKDKQTARVAGEFYVNAINVMRGAEGLSTYAPIDESEKFRIEYWALEEAKLARMPKPKPLASRIPRSSPERRRASARRPAEKLAAEGRLRRHRRPFARQGAGRGRGDRQHRRRRRPTGRRVERPTPCRAAVAAAVLAFGGIDLVVNNAGLSLSRSLLETTEADWDLQHDVMAQGNRSW